MRQLTRSFGVRFVSLGVLLLLPTVVLGQEEVPASEPSCPPPTELTLPASIEDSLSADDCRSEELFGYPRIGEYLDLYSVTLPASGVLSISLTALSAAGAVYVWDSDLQEIVFDDFSFNYGNFINDGTATVSDFLPAGTYLIQVFFLNAPPPTVPYSLDVDFEETNFDPDVQLLAAVLPGSRSAQVGSGDYATAFATIVNVGRQTGIDCEISPATAVPAQFFYRPNNGADGAPLPANVPLDFPPYGAPRNYVFGFLPDAPFDPTEIEFEFRCINAAPAPVVSGLNTLLLSAAADPVADIMVNSATLCKNGLVRLSPFTGAGVFAAAATNLGASDALTVSIDTGRRSLPVSLSLCQTDSLGRCINPPIPSADPVPLTLESREVATFGLFVTASSPIESDAARNRLFVRFRDSSGVVRGSTSVAVQTEGASFLDCR